MVRRYVVLVHRGLALTLGAWILLQSVTGFVLVFRDQLEAWSRPELFAHEHEHGDLGPEAALRAVRTAYPGRLVGALTTPEVSGHVYVVSLGAEQVFVDPATARVNGSRNVDEGFTAAMLRLHQSLLADRLFGVDAEKVVAGLAIAWLGVVLTGGVAAATFGHWRNVLRIRRRRGLGKTMDLHRTVGVITAIPVLLVVVTGIRLAAPDEVDGLWAGLTGSGKARADVPPPDTATISADLGGVPLQADAVLDVVRASYPRATITRLTMPLDGDRAAPVVVSLSVGYDPGRGPRGAGGNTTLMLDQYDGHELWTGRQQDLPALRQALETWSRPLHTGTFGHTATRLLWEVLAAATLVLGGSGHFILLLRRQINRRRRLPWRRHVRRRRQRHRVFRLRQRDLVHRRKRARRDGGQRPGDRADLPRLKESPGAGDPEIIVEVDEADEADALV